MGCGCVVCGQLEISNFDIRGFWSSIRNRKFSTTHPHPPLQSLRHTFASREVLSKISYWIEGWRLSKVKSLILKVSPHVILNSTTMEVIITSTTRDDDEDYSNYFRYVHPVWYVVVPTTMTLLIVFAFFFSPPPYEGGNPSNAYEAFQLCNTYILKLFRKQVFLRVFFAVICFSHVCEAVTSFQIASRMGFSNTRYYWMLQTLLLGAPSFQLLMRKRRKIILKRAGVILLY